MHFIPTTWLRYFLLVVLLSLLLSCGGGDGEDSSEFREYGNGVFVDEAVAGITYSWINTYDGGVITGTTYTSGEFNYQKGQSLRFSVGGVALPVLSDGAPFITPYDFGNERVAINIARFLQSLDNDPNSPGLDITAAAAALESVSVTSDVFSAADADAFEAAIESAVGDENLITVSEPDAIAALEAGTENSFALSNTAPGTIIDPVAEVDDELSNKVLFARTLENNPNYGFVYFSSGAEQSNDSSSPSYFASSWVWTENTNWLDFRWTTVQSTSDPTRNTLALVENNGFNSSLFKLGKDDHRLYVGYSDQDGDQTTIIFTKMRTATEQNLHGNNSRTFNFSGYNLVGSGFTNFDYQITFSNTTNNGLTIDNSPLYDCTASLNDAPYADGCYWRVMNNVGNGFNNDNSGLIQVLLPNSNGFYDYLLFGFLQDGGFDSPDAGATVRGSTAFVTGEIEDPINDNGFDNPDRILDLSVNEIFD